MKMSIQNMKDKIKEMEIFIYEQPQDQCDIYISGYTQALKDHGILISDVDHEELTKKYRKILYTRIIDRYEKGDVV